MALRSLGRTEPADDAAAFIAGLQLDAGDDLGAVALNAAGFASGGDGIQILERDGFRRASTQGVLAFGLPSYSEIGVGAVDPAAFEPCTVDPPPVADAAGTLSATTVVAGGTLTVSGVGFLPGESVKITLHSTPIELGTVTAAADKTVSLTFTVPADIEPGDHTIKLLGLTSGRVVELPFEVLGVDVPRTLPATGRTTSTQASTGAGLLVLGAAFVALARRRQAACV